MPSAVEAATIAYRALASRIDGVLASGANELATAGVAFMLHALYAGLATNELARQAPPAGVGFWSHVPQLDAEKPWHDAGSKVGRAPARRSIPGTAQRAADANLGGRE